jgi:hypothetical protein
LITNVSCDVLKCDAERDTRIFRDTGFEPFVAPGQGENMNQGTWQSREDDLIKHINEEIERYKGFSERSRVAGRSLSVCSLVCSVLAPVAVVSQGGNNGLAALGFNESHIAAVAVILTILLAFLEGLRRTFRFEQRWAEGLLAWVAIEREREIYLDSQIDKAVGSDDWIKNLTSLRQAVDRAISVETSAFFEPITAASKPKG